MSLVDRPSPNFNDRPADKPVSILLLHYTGMETAAAALERLCDSAAKVSAHYTVDEDGAVYAHVAEDKRAWHAGVSYWAGETDINGISVGVEIVNPGHEFGYRPFPAAQIDAVALLCQNILGRHPIPPHRVLGHSDVAPGRRQDPGELFPWQDFAARGIGLWPGAATTTEPPDLLILQRQLRDIGYDCPETGAADSATAEIVTAFQRHFRPGLIDGIADAETAACAAALMQRIPIK
jgi:N-acetylmuramoyl-L-alanine amidase